MKKFTLRFFAFMGFPFLLVIIDLMSPLNAFTFRQWESLEYLYPCFTEGYFYPSQRVSMYEVGDLGRHTPYEVKKYTTWKTDSLGYRNENYQAYPDILLIGDSFFAGSSLTQDSIIGYRVQQKLNNLHPGKINKVYNCSPNSFERFDDFLKLDLLHKPRVIVFSVVEKNLNSLGKEKPANKNTLKERLIYAMIGWIPYQIPMYIDRLVKFNLLHYVSVKVNPLNILNYFKGTMNKGNTIVKADRPRMLFWQDAKARLNPNDTVLEEAINKLISYNRYCESLNIQFLFVPIPDKETAYYDMFNPHEKQPAFLIKVDSLMQKNHIHALNTMQLFNIERKNMPGKMLYQFDDTHWNANAVELLADGIVKKIDELQDKQ